MVIHKFGRFIFGAFFSVFIVWGIIQLSKIKKEMVEIRKDVSKSSSRVENIEKNLKDINCP